MHWLIGALVSPALLSESDAQRTHFEGAERRTKCSESFSLWDAALLNNPRRLMDKPLWGLRVDGPLGRRFLRDLSLTRLWREGCCRAPLNDRRRQFV